MFSKLTQLHNSKSGKFFNYTFPTAGQVVFFIVIALFVTYLINWFMNQFFGTKIIPLGTPLKFLIIALALVSTFFIIGRRQGDLDRNAIFAIVLVAGGSGLLFWSLPTLLPELFKQPIINSAYANPNSPIYIWNNATQSVVSGVQSILQP